MNSKSKIEELFDKGILINKELLEKDIDDTLLDKIESEADLVVLNEDYANIITTQSSLVDWYEIDKYRVETEKDRDDDLYQSQLQQFQQVTVATNEHKQEVSSLEVELDEDSTEFNVEAEMKEMNIMAQDSIPSIDSVVTVVFSYKNVPHKYAIKDFTNFFLSRYKFLEGILRSRRELENTTSINRLQNKQEREKVSIIGLVEEIGETRNGNIMLTLEDPTGRMKVLVSKNNKQLFVSSKDLVFDEVIGISGTMGENIIFADTIVWPDIPPTHELKMGPEEEYAIFLSDLHVGSKYFLNEEFSKFLKWIRSEAGNEEQRKIAKAVKYIIIAGDLVDGIGIYPGQEKELSITTIDGQYEEFSRLISQVPQDKQIIVCPGNHDMVHLAEPQSVFYKEFAPGMFDLPNITMVTNPAMINVGKKKGFEGFDILLYHGYSFDYYVSNVESIRMGGGYHRADLIMKFLLQRRHLAPSFKSTPYYPSHEQDPLSIKEIPDFLITGHIHYSSVANYRGITMISGSCWQAKTDFQEKLGHDPEPARVPIVNLKTRKIKILRFG